MEAHFTVDTSRFEARFREYMQWSGRSFSDACNEKAFFIARRAVWETKKASDQDIKSVFGEATQLKQRKYKGVLGHRKTRNLSEFSGVGRNDEAPMLALIVNARRGAKKQKGLYGHEMLLEMNRVFNARMASIAFVRSGFVPAIKHLEQFSRYGHNAPPEDPGTRVIGQAKGGAQEAKWAEGVNRIEATIWNSVGQGKPRRGRLEAVLKYGTEGLQAAVDFERESMGKYIEDKMAANVERFNST